MPITSGERQRLGLLTGAIAARCWPASAWLSSRIHVTAAGDHTSGFGPSIESFQPAASACSVAPDFARTTRTLTHWWVALKLPARSLSSCDFSSEEVTVIARLEHAEPGTCVASKPVSTTATRAAGAGIESPYTYRVGDRLCRGSTPAAIEPGTPLTVYYDPKDPCSSVSTNPVETRFGHQAMLLVFAAYLAALLWVVRISSQPSREMTWQVR